MNQDSLVQKQLENAQIVWGARLFIAFLRFAERRTYITEEQKDLFLKELKSFLEQIENKNSEELVVLLNQQIDTANSYFKEHVGLGLYAPFPHFALSYGSFSESAVLDQLDMVERTLTEAAKADVIGWGEEGTYFKEILEVFTKVENKSLKPKDGMSLLALKMQKINSLLPEEMHLPVPELSAYDI